MTAPFPPFSPYWVIDARIPPLDGHLLLGFTAGTGGGSATFEVDNFIVTRLAGCGGAAGGQRPGDCNQDGTLDISDAICILGFLFQGKPVSLPCGDGTASDPGNLSLVDLNGDSGLDVSDGVYCLAYLFSGGKPPVLGTACSPVAGCSSRCE